MNDTQIVPDPQTERSNPELNSAAVTVQMGRASFHSEVAVTTKGLLAIGGLVSGILLSVVPIVWVATRKAPDRSPR